MDTKPWIDLEALLEAADAEGLASSLAALPPGEPARAMAHLDVADRERVLLLLQPAQAAELLGALPAAQVVDVVEQLEAEPAAAIVEALPSQERADVLGTLDEAKARAIYDALPAAVASDARRLASYAPDTAGGLMATESLVFRDHSRVQDGLDDLRTNAESYSDYEVQYAYVTDAEGCLVGVLRLRDLLLQPSSRSVAGLMIREPTSVDTGAGLDALAGFFEAHAFLGVPAVDEAGRLRGVVRRGNVRAALGDRDRSDHLKAVGIVGGEELRSVPILTRARRRLAWLSVNVLLNVAAASVIAAYQDTLAAVIALAVFLPIISNMSGCSGSQAVAVSMRELSLGLAKPADALHVLGKEIGVGPS